MRYLAFCLFLVLTFGISVAAQAPAPVKACDLSLSNAPTVRGIKLGMSLAELQKKLPRLEAKRVDEYGRRAIDYYYPSRADDNMQGVEKLSFLFLDDSLVSFSILYDSDASTRWNLRELAPKISEGINLSGEWQFSERIYDEYASIECRDFDVSVKLEIRAPLLSMRQKDYMQIITKRRKDLEKKQKETFKP